VGLLLLLPLQEARAISKKLKNAMVLSENWIVFFICISVVIVSFWQLISYFFCLWQNKDGLVVIMIIWSAKLSSFVLWFSNI
jgi:hypothetical protein